MTAAPYLLGRRGPGVAVIVGGGTGSGDGIDDPVVTTTSSGDTTIKGKVKPGSFGKFVVPLATVQAGRQYTFRYTPQFAQLAQQGKLAMVGFGFKSNNDFHIAGLRGDGSTGLRKYQVYGTPPNGWNAQTGHTVNDGGAAASGTQAGPNYLRLTISADGAAYTLQSSADGSTWNTEFTGQTPSPFSNVSGVATFGVALWFNNADAGPFSITIDQFSVLTNTSLDAATKGSNVTLSNGSLTAANSGSSRTGARSVKSKASGKYYFEATVDVRASVSPNEHFIGIAIEEVPYGDICPVATMAAGIFVNNNSGAATIWANGINSGASLATLANGDRLDFAVDLDNGKIYIRKNGGSWEGSGTDNPATNTGGVSLTNMAGMAFSPVWATNHSGDQVTFNFGDTAFAGTVPSGFTSGWPSTPDDVNASGYTTFLSPNNVNVTLSNSNKTVTHANSTAAIARSINQKASGKYYIEYTWTHIAGANDGCGFADAGATAANVGSNGTHCATVYRSGNIYRNGSNSGVTLSTVADGDRIGCAIDLDNKTVWFRKNNGNWNNSGTADPATNTGGLSTSTYPAMAPHCSMDGAGTQIIVGNFGASSFVDTVPSGFTAGWPAP